MYDPNIWFCFVLLPNNIRTIFHSVFTAGHCCAQLLADLFGHCCGIVQNYVQYCTHQPWRAVVYSSTDLFGHCCGIACILNYAQYCTRDTASNYASMKFGAVLITRTATLSIRF